MSVFISELMGQAKQWWQADISTRTGMKKSTSNVIEKAEPTVRKAEKKGDGEMRFKKQLVSPPDIEDTKKKSRVKPSIREILSQIGGVLLIIAMFLAFAVAVVALLEQLFGFPWGKPLMERLGTPALIIIVVALWLSDPKRMALLMHQIIQLLFACSCAVGVLLYARTGGAVQEDQAMALLFCVLGIPGLASFIFSITRRRDADDILKFRKTTFYPLLIIVSGAIGQCSAIFGKVLAGVVMGALSRDTRKAYGTCGWRSRPPHGHRRLGSQYSPPTVTRTKSSGPTNTKCMSVVAAVFRIYGIRQRPRMKRFPPSTMRLRGKTNAHEIDMEIPAVHTISGLKIG